MLTQNSYSTSTHTIGLSCTGLATIHNATDRVIGTGRLCCSIGGLKMVATITAKVVVKGCNTDDELRDRFELQGQIISIKPRYTVSLFSSTSMTWIERAQLIRMARTCILPTSSPLRQPVLTAISRLCHHQIWKPRLARPITFIRRLRK